MVNPFQQTIAVELKFISKDVKTSFKIEMAFIGVIIDKTFGGKYLELDSKLTSIYKLKRIGEYFEDIAPALGWEGK